MPTMGAFKNDYPQPNYLKKQLWRKKPTRVETGRKYEQAYNWLKLFSWIYRQAWAERSCIVD